MYLECYCRYCTGNQDKNAEEEMFFCNVGISANLSTVSDSVEITSETLEEMRVRLLGFFLPAKFSLPSIAL